MANSGVVPSSSGWSAVITGAGNVYTKLNWSSTYHPEGNYSTITVSPYFHAEYNVGSDVRFYDGGLYGNGSSLYSCSSKYYEGNRLVCTGSTSWISLSPNSGSISSFTVNHNSTGSATFTVGMRGRICVLNDKTSAVFGNNSVSVTITESKTLRVIYNANGGSGQPADTYFYGTVQFQLSSETPTRTGYTFTGWNTAADGSGTSYSPGQSVTMTATTTLYAQWSVNSYNVSLFAGTDVDAVSGGGSYTYGSSVTITATLGSVAGYTYAFDGWYDENDTPVSSSLSYTFTLADADVSLTAKASKTPNDYTLSVTAGDYIDSVSGGGTVTYGDSPTVAAVLGSTVGYTTVFDGWYNGADKVSSALSYTFAMPPSDLSLTAKGVRTINYYSVSVSAGSYVASVSGGGSKAYGSSVTVTAVLGSASGYTYSFDGWYDGETKVSSSLSYTFTMGAEDVALVARATRAVIPYALVISPGTGSAITVERTSSPNAGAATGVLSSSDPIYYGDVLSVVFVATPGYTLATRTINGNAVAATVSYTVTGNTTIAATATLNEYTLSLSISNSGVVASVLRMSSPNGGGSVGQIYDGDTLYYGDELLISYDYGLGYQVDAHTINGIDFDSGVPYTVVGDTVVVITASASGFVYINNQPYLIYVGDGSNWVRYQAHIGDGTSWVAH